MFQEVTEYTQFGRDLGVSLNLTLFKQYKNDPERLKDINKLVKEGKYVSFHAPRGNSVNLHREKSQILVSVWDFKSKVETVFWFSATGAYQKTQSFEFNFGQGPYVSVPGLSRSEAATYADQILKLLHEKGKVKRGAEGDALRPRY